MAITYVQELLKGFNGSAGTTVTATGSKTLTLGNYVVVQATFDTSSGTITVTDNLGNTYNEIYDSSTSGSVNVVLFEAVVTNAGTLTTLTAVGAVSTTEKALTSLELSGSFAPFANTENHATSTTPSVAMANSDGIHFWCLGILDTGASSMTINAPSGYTQGAGQSSNTNERQGVIFYKIGAETGGTVSSTISPSKEWLVVSAAATEVGVRPDLTGVSFDGVTVR